MKLIVGLGNPGFRYRNTRHNVGFLAIKELSKKLKVSINKKKYDGVFGKGSFGMEEIVLFMPQTYMNLSGEAVKKLIRKINVKPEDLLVICDDFNLKLGFIRLKRQGSYGGHNGLESIIGSLGTEKFPRLRIGIGQDTKLSDVVRFVLTSFKGDEKPALKEAIKEARDCAISWLGDGAETAMTKFNRKQISA